MSVARLLHRPIYGGVFGEDGRFALASAPCVWNGLHATRYMVIQPDAGTVLSIAHEKIEALAIARERLTAANDKRPPVALQGSQAELWPDEPLLQVQADKPRVVPRRRREVFEQSRGSCHYCGTVLTLDGKWHVEHQLPRALGGSDDNVNLVASCVACNLSKSDRTAIEFASGRQSK